MLRSTTMVSSSNWQWPYYRYLKIKTYCTNILSPPWKNVLPFPYCLDLLTTTATDSSISPQYFAYTLLFDGYLMTEYNLTWLIRFLLLYRISSELKWYDKNFIQLVPNPINYLIPILKNHCEILGCVSQNVSTSNLIMTFFTLLFEEDTDEELELEPNSNSAFIKTPVANYRLLTQTRPHYTNLEPFPCSFQKCK